MDKSSCKKYIVYFLILCLLITLCNTQKGGGKSKGSSSRSSSKSRRSRSELSFFLFLLWPFSSWKYNILYYIVLIVAIVIFGKYAQKQLKIKDQKRNDKIAAALKQYEAKSQEVPSSLSEADKSALIDKFKKKLYTLVAKGINSPQDVAVCEVKITDIQKQSGNKYFIELSGNSQNGICKLRGLLIFRADGMGFKISFDDQARVKDEMIKTWDISLYQGLGNPDKIQGSWLKIKEDNAGESSGTWTCTDIIGYLRGNLTYIS